jgi:hypothetical protein
MIDWKKEIATIFLLHQEIDRLDRDHIWDHRLPNVAAPESTIEAVRAKYRDRLSDSHLEFLRYADGWTNVLQYVDLFGTSDLLGGERSTRARAALHELAAASVLSASGVDQHNAVIVAASSADPDVYVSPLKGCENEGAVYWFAGSEIQRFADFEDFFLGLVDYNRRSLKRMQARAPRA